MGGRGRGRTRVCTAYAVVGFLVVRWFVVDMWVCGVTCGCVGSLLPGLPGLPGVARVYDIRPILNFTNKNSNSKKSYMLFPIKTKSLHVMLCYVHNRYT